MSAADGDDGDIDSPLVAGVFAYLCLIYAAVNRKSLSHLQAFVTLN